MEFVGEPTRILIPYDEEAEAALASFRIPSHPGAHPVAPIEA